jgi:uncharacterized protein YciI
VPTFAVTLENGPSWDYSRGRREQERWHEHAAFMDRLVDDGFVVIGGPLGDVDGKRTMHAVEAADEAAVRARFAEDPWAPMRLLRIVSVEPWTIWLDGRGR